MKATYRLRALLWSAVLIMTTVSITACGTVPAEDSAKNEAKTESETESRLERISEEHAMIPATEGDTVYLLPHYQIGSGSEVEEGMLCCEEEADDLAIKLTVPTGYQLEKTTEQIYIEYDLRDSYAQLFGQEEDYVNSERWLLAVDEEAHASEIQLYYGLCEKEKWLQELYDTDTFKTYEVVGKMTTAAGEAVLYKNPEVYDTEGDVDYYEYYILIETTPGPVIITFTDYHLEEISQTPIRLMKELFAA